MDNYQDSKMKEKYKDRLKKILGKKIETTMIFPLGEFERAFGFLWGIGKDENSLTSQEKEFKDKWINCRENILNVGNQQKRNMFSEINMHTVVWNRYQTTLFPVNRIFNQE